MGIGLSFFMHIFVFIISSARSKSPLIKGVLLSTEENELGIKVGGVLSILGDVVYNFKDKTLRIDNPILLMRRKKVFNCIIFYSKHCNILMREWIRIIFI